ncbi:MAG: ParB/RepB/Spo0J family partition protein [Gemmatimonadota bacterium]
MKGGAAVARNDSRLGRGLGALLGEYLEEEETGAPEQEVSIALIRANPHQPRSEFSDASLAELSESIRKNGLLQPLVVRRTESGLELVAGERRWRAVKRLGWETVPVVVRTVTDDQMLLLALVENLQREDLSPLEEARGYQRLIEEYGFTQRQVGEHVGRDRSTVSNSLRLLTLPRDVQGMLRSGQLSVGHARAVLGLEKAAQRVQVARRIVAKGLSVRETERLIRSLRAPPHSRRARPVGRDGKAPDPVARRAERILARALGTQVRVRPRRGGGGEIAVVYHDGEDFGRVFRQLAGDAAAELLDSV